VSARAAGWLAEFTSATGLTADQVVSEPAELAGYGADAYSYHSGGPPELVVKPASTEQVAAVVRWCAAARVPIIARGSGTSLEGHTTTPAAGIVVDLSSMDRVIAVRPGDLDCTVQAGVTWQALNAELAAAGTGLFFPMDPGPGASIGGMVGTRCR